MSLDRLVDYGTYLEDFIQTIENLPGEIHHLFTEIRERGQDLQELKEKMKEQDMNLRKLIKLGSNHPDPTKSEIKANGGNNIRNLLPTDQKEIYDKIQNGFVEAMKLSDEQVKVADRALAMVDRHIKRLTTDLDKMNELEGLPPVSSVPLPNYVYQLVDGSVSGAGTTSISQTSFSDSPVLGLSFLSNGRTQGTRPNSARKGIKRRVFGEAIDGQEEIGDADEPVYCFCQQVSYGEMIGCENGEDCPFEWFHLDCVGLAEPPVGVWFCPECARKKKKLKT